MTTENAGELDSLRTSEKDVLAAIDDVIPLVEENKVDARLLRALTHLTGAVHHLVAAGIARHEQGKVAAASDAYAALAAAQDDEDQEFHDAMRERRREPEPEPEKAARPAYRVAVRWWKTGLELDVEGVGVTQSRDQDDAEAMVRDLIHRRTGVPADSFDVVWTLGATSAG